MFSIISGAKQSLCDLRLTLCGSLRRVSMFFFPSTFFSFVDFSLYNQGLTLCGSICLYKDSMYYLNFYPFPNVLS